jgi:ADP-ribosyl-[dinitrogen reductase] hydrolase
MVAESLPRDRAIGSLVGLAVGDAVGTTVEFLPRDSYPPVTDMVGGGRFKLAPGQWTDDTSMALCLAESLLANPECDQTDLMQRFHAWAADGVNSSNGKCFGIGRTTLRAIGHFHKTGVAVAGPTHSNDAGNGSIMRLAPAAIRWWRQPEFAESVAERQSVTTHGAPEAVAGCSLLARVLCRAIAGDGWDSIFVDDEQWPPLIRAVGQGASIKRSQAEISSSGYVVHTLEAAYWACKRSSNFDEAILTAANLGNDADTVAAVVGQIAGAVWGLSGIPTRWVERLHDSQRIQDLASELFDASEAWIPGDKRDVWVIEDAFVCDAYLGGTQLGELPDFDLSSCRVVRRLSQERLDDEMAQFFAETGYSPD